jgi:glycosyltransferase involved in cell wall biosynthesis
MKPRVVYWNNIPSPYMVERFNALAVRPNIDFQAWFSNRTAPDRSWRVEEDTWLFPYRYLPRVGSARLQWSLPTPIFGRHAPELLVSLHSQPDFLAGCALARLRGARIAFWVLPTYDSWVDRREWKEAAKRQVFPRADAVLTSGRDGRDFARRYGARDDRIFYVPQVINVDHFAKARAISAQKRQDVRATLGVQGVTFVCVGRLWLGKGVGFLIDAFAAVRRHVGEDAATLLLVGDGVDERRFRRQAADVGPSGILFTGFVHSDVLPEIYAASDVFVFPTLGDPYGLVVLEAMAAGLPIISTRAAGEIYDRVEEGVNGFLVDPGSAEQLAARMLVLMQDEAVRRRMGAASASRVAGQTPDAWAEAFEQAVDKILSRRPARQE